MPSQQLLGNFQIWLNQTCCDWSAHLKCLKYLCRNSILNLSSSTFKKNKKYREIFSTKAAHGSWNHVLTESSASPRRSPALWYADIASTTNPTNPAFETQKPNGIGKRHPPSCLFIAKGTLTMNCIGLLSA